MAPVRRLLGKLEYIGTDYLGWQTQPQGPTVQAVLERSLAQLVGCPLAVLAPSRTDSGVHAFGQLFCVDLPSSTDIPLKRLFLGLNRILPPSITLKDLVQVQVDFKIRENTGKAYRYRVWEAPFPSAFFSWNHWWIKHPLEVPLMQKAATQLLGTHDFSSFRAKGCQSPTRIKTLNQLNIQVQAQPEGRVIEFYVQGDHFLRKMIRILVGTLVEIGWRRRAVDSITPSLAAKDRRSSGQTAPAHGLCLEQVYFEPDPFLSRSLLGWEKDQPDR